jgi:predicted dehydrogenase
LRVSLAGLGAAATRGHLPALLKLESEGRVQVVGACDPDERQRAAVQQGFPRLPTFASADEMLESVGSELAVIAAYPAAHAALATIAAGHGQHILCEKPAGGTPAQMSQFAAIWRRQRSRGLVASYQYRFSDPWIVASTFLRAAARSGQRVVMSVEVERTSTDRRAMSSWRDDTAMGGGLADHAVHFLALGRELGHPFTVDFATRKYDSVGRERVRALVSAGPNLLDISVSYRAARRSTTLMLSCGKLRLRWRGRNLTIEEDGRCGRPVSVPSLSDRSHVDALYLPMYRDLLAGLGNLRWRHDRADELIEVGCCLNMLLAETEPSIPVEPTALAA